MRCACDWTTEGTTKATEGAVQIVEFGLGRSVWMARSTNALLAGIQEVPHSFSVVAIDAQRSPDSKEQPEAYRQWLHGVDALIECAALGVRPEGRVFVELEPSNLSVYLEVLNRYGLHVVEAIAWQKKYSGQNSRRDFENLHDFILIAERESSALPVPITFLPFKVAGKSEDAAREFNELAHEIMGDGAFRAPEPLKPVALFQWLAANRVDSADSLLDLTSCAASWSSQVSENCATTVDVLWPDEQWFEASSWLLSHRLRMPNRNSSLSASIDMHPFVFEGKPCECELITRLLPRPRRSQVRLDFPSDSGTEGAVDSLAGEVHDLVDSLTHFLRKRVLDSFGSLSLLSTSGEELSGLLTPDGVAALLLEGDWPRDLLRLTKTVGHARVVGNLVLYGDDEVVGDAQVIALISAWPRRYVPHPLWRARAHEYSNADEDPRGPWRNPGHKGARSGGPGTSFRLFRPPYMWEVKNGILPPGIWRINPISGVIWGSPTELGSWDVEVQATDSAGQRASAQVTFEVVPQHEAEATQVDLSDYQWLFEPLASVGRLRVKKRHIRLPLGVTASIVMTASGGSPRVVEVPAPGNALVSGRTRYWEFSKASLIAALLNDSLLFPTKVDAKPSIRQHQSQIGTRHAAMPSVMSSSGLSARDFFWNRISRSGNDEVVLDWNGTVGDAAVRLSTGAPKGRRARAFACEPCLQGSQIGQGCCKEHAVQPHGVLVESGSLSEPEKLLDLSGQEAGLLFKQTPVSAETLQLLELEGTSGKVLAVICTNRTDTDVVPEKVAWLS